MERMPSDPIVGSHHAYRWLMTNRENMNEFLRQCPGLVLGKYVAITTYDSGVLRLSERDATVGWESRNGIAYSRQIGALSDLPEIAQLEPAELYQEWYVFRAATKLGGFALENAFVTPPPGLIVTFVNYSKGFALHDPEVQVMTDLFWKQVEELKPESYMGEGEDYTTFVTDNAALFDAVLRILEPPRDSS